MTIEPFDEIAAWRQLGQKPAASGKAGDFARDNLAAHPQIHYARSTIANVEIGRQRVHRGFWRVCDQAFATDGAFVAEYDSAYEGSPAVRMFSRALTAEVEVCVE